ncbi:MAG: hypothetical protein AB4290_08295 [Spirulina sp.]
MSLIPVLRPEQEKLIQQRRILHQRDRAMIQKEEERAILRAELAAFELTYNRRIGWLYVELDELEARTLELRFQRHPEDRSLEQQVLEAKMQAEASRQAYNQAETISEPKIKPSATIRDLFRQLAKLAHPDLTTNEVDKQWRKEFMQAANLAYKNGDEVKLRSLLRQIEDPSHVLETLDVEAELEQIQYHIKQVELRTDAIAEDIADLKQQSLYQLRARVLEARSKGRDLLTEMSAELREMLDQARQEFDALKAQIN